MHVEHVQHIQQHCVSLAHNQPKRQQNTGYIQDLHFVHGDIYMVYTMWTGLTEFFSQEFKIVQKQN